MYKISPVDMEREALLMNLTKEELRVPKTAIFTFNKSILDEFKESINLRNWEWPAARFSPYSAYNAEYWKGEFEDEEVMVIVPPMGASPVASLTEELIHFGAEKIFLLCASWSLGAEYLGPGVIHVPNFASGLDGTSIHYGNNDRMVETDTEIMKIAESKMDEMDADWKEGGVGSFEAIYRISDDIIKNFREKGCLSVENGEVATLYAIGKTFNIPVVILLQSYITLEDGWKLSYMDEKYAETCKLQAKISLKVLKEI